MYEIMDSEYSVSRLPNSLTIRWMSFNLLNSLNLLLVKNVYILYMPLQPFGTRWSAVPYSLILYSARLALKACRLWLSLLFTLAGIRKRRREEEGRGRGKEEEVGGVTYYPDRHARNIFTVDVHLKIHVIFTHILEYK